jgi:hypothetical protein
MAETNTTNLETTITGLRARNAELEANLRKAKVREKVLAAENEQLHESIKEAIEKRGDMAGELLKAKIKLSILERQSKAWDNYLDETWHEIQVMVCSGLILGRCDVSMPGALTCILQVGEAARSLGNIRITSWWMLEM